MKVRGRKIETVELEVDESEIIEKTVRIIAEKTDMVGRWVEDGKVMEDDPSWRHGSVSSVFVRDATPEDIEANRVVKYIRELCWKK